jgi:hypothetical protein
MANEITMNAFFQVENLIADKKTIATSLFTQTGSGRVANTVAVPNDSDLALALGGVTTCGLAYFKNLALAASTTHIISIGPDATGLQAAIRLAPQQWCVVFLAAAPYARAAAGTPLLDYIIFQQ